ncbi:UNVERIFIED_CONTAM: hypothetical protein HDU68_011643, partial [Siphonaria sp. JEL0065]
LYKGPVSNIKSQLAKACSQTSPVAAVWVLAFGVPADLEVQYKLAAQEANESPACLTSNTSVSFTASEFNYKFHGRFLLAPMAASISGSKYLMIVDDDVVLTRNIVRQFVEHMNVKPRLLGTAGQLRGPRNGIEPGWQHPKSPDLLKSHPRRGDQPLVDYLCNIWFFKSSWTNAAFARDHPLTWYTGEDIHLAFTLKKYLGIESAVINVTPDSEEDSPMKLESKKHVANHEKRVADVRNDMFRVNLGRGFRPYLGGALVKTLVFVQDLETAAAFSEAFNNVGADAENDNSLPDSLRESMETPSCMLFAGRESSLEKLDLLRHIAVEFSDAGSCKLYMKPKWGAQPRAIRYFDMRLGLGVEQGEYPLSTLLSDLIPALTGILTGGIDTDALERIVVVTRIGGEGELYQRIVRLVVDMVNMGVSGLGGGSAGSNEKPRKGVIEVLELRVQTEEDDNRE